MVTCLRYLSLTVVCLIIWACLSAPSLAAKKGKTSTASRRARAEKNSLTAKGRKGEAKARHGKQGRHASETDESPWSRRSKKRVAKQGRRDAERSRPADEDAADESVAPREAETRVSYPVVPDQIEVIEFGSERARSLDLPQMQRFNFTAGGRTTAASLLGAPKRRLDLAIESARVVEIQKALAARGYFTGEPTGAWDDATFEAMRRFQFEHKIDATGYPTAHALKLLGLTN